MNPYVPGEQPQGGGYVKLNTNENPYPPSPRVLTAIHEAVGESLRLYPDPVACELSQTAAAVYGVPAENVMAGNGSDELLSLIFRACIGAGDRVAWATPSYSLYETLVAIQDGEVVRVSYPPDFSLPAELGEIGARVTIVCHPNAPSGVAARLEEIERLAQQVGGVLVVDEAYVDFAEANAMPLAMRYDNVVVLRTLSKSYSLAGMRVGLAVGSKALLGEVFKVKDSYNLNRLSIRAGAAALADQDWMIANVAKVKATRARLTNELRQRGFAVPDSQANFVLARRAGESQHRRYAALKEKRILVRYFDTPELADALRITVGTDAEIDALLRALDEIG